MQYKFFVVFTNLIRICIGFLEFVLSCHPIAGIMRENFVFKIIPMVNPDGVFLGNNRCNLVGQDMNRCWNVASEFSSPTILATKVSLKILPYDKEILNLKQSISVNAEISFKFAFIHSFSGIAQGTGQFRSM